MTFTGRAQVRIAWATEPFNPSPTWTDVTGWIRLDKTMSLQRGRQDNITSISAGRMTTTADNSDGRWTVGRSTSPWYPGVKIGRRVQVNVPDETGTLHTRFDGMLTEVPTEFDGGPGIVSLSVIQASDILAWLARVPSLLSWTQQEMLLDAPAAVWSLADTSNTTSATDQAGQGAAPLQIVSQGDGSGTASPGGGVPLIEIQTADYLTQQQTTQTFTFTTPGPFTWPAPLGTLVSCDVQCVAGGNAGSTGGGGGGPGGAGAEYAEEPDVGVTPGNTYSGSVGSPGAPSAGSGTNTTFTGDSATVTAHASGSGSANTIHHNGGAGAAAAGGASGGGGGGGSSGGQYQAGNGGTPGKATAGGTGGTAPIGGGGGGGGDFPGGGGTPGSAPGGGGGGGSASAGGAGGPGQVTIIYTYIPPPSDQQNSTLSSWLFTPSATLAARILQGALPAPVTAAAGFAAEIWADFASFPAAAVSTFTTPGPFTWPAPPGITAPDVAAVAGSNAGSTGGGGGGAGAVGAEYAEEPALAVTPNNIYSGTVGSPGAPSAGTGTDTTFTGDSATVHAHAAGTGSSNTIHHNGGAGAAAAGGASGGGGGGGSSGGQYQAGNGGTPGKATAGGAAGGAVTGGGGGGAGDFAGGGGTPGSAPGGGGGGGSASAGGGGAPGECLITATLAVSTLLTLCNPRGQSAIAVWVTAAGHLQLASTSNYGTRGPTWVTADAGQVPSEPFHVVISVAATTRVATLYVNDVAAGTLTLPAGASYTTLTVGGSYAGWLGGWNGSAGLAAVYPASLSSARVGVHYTAGTTGFIGSSTGTMIAKIAAYVGLPSFYYTPPSGPSDPSYGLTLVSYYDLNGQQPVTQMQLYEQAEAGVLSVTAAGQLVFADRASRYAAAAAGSAFTLLAGQYEPDTSFKSNDQYLATQACLATSNIPGGYPVTNAPATLDYGPYTQNSGTVSSPAVAPFADATATTGTGTYSADDLMDAGWWQVNVFGQPPGRVPALTVDLLTLPASEFSIASFYGNDIGSAIRLAGLPSQAPDVTGAPLGAYEVIEGINETIDLKTHTVQLYTSPLAQSAAWIIGDNLLGVLDTTTVVGRSQAPSAVGPPYGPPPTFGSTLNRTGSVGAQDLRTLTANTQNRLTPALATGQQATAQTITTLTGQPVTWDTLLADTQGGFGSLTAYTVQAGWAGYYLCTAVVQAATGTASLGGIAAWFAATLSGTASQWGAETVPYLSTAPYTSVAIRARIGPCAAGDTIQVIAAAAGTPASMPLEAADGGSMFTLLWQGD
jgi:hypothetical protein